MKLAELRPVVTKLTSDLYSLEFDCPTCMINRIQVTFCLGEPRHQPPRAWGATTIDPERMTVQPSVSNSYHGRKRCDAHVVITHGEVEKR